MSREVPGLNLSKELNLVSGGKYSSQTRSMVVGESLKNYSKGSPRMAGKSTRGKKKKKMKPETRPRIRAAGDRMGAVLGLWAHSSLSHQLLPTDII